MFQEVPDSPRLQHMIRTDPAFLEIVDADFFERSPQESKVTSKMDRKAGDKKLDEEALDTATDCDIKVGTETTELTSGLEDKDKADKEILESKETEIREKENNGKVEVSLGSDPKWDDVAKSVKEKVRLMKEQELLGKNKKKGLTWGKKRKAKKDSKDDSSFVKRKEVDEGINSTMSSTATLTQVEIQESKLDDIFEGAKPITPILLTTDTSYYYTAHEDVVMSDDVTDHTTVSDNFTDTLPSLSGVPPPPELGAFAPGEFGDAGTTPPPPQYLGTHYDVCLLSDIPVMMLCYCSQQWCLRRGCDCVEL